MTSGFDLIIQSLFPSRKGPSPRIEILTNEDTLTMLEELAHGQPFSSGELATSIFNNAVEDHYITKNHNVQKWEDLSDRQKQVAAMACLGYTNAEIAEKLNVSLTTVKAHIRETLRKFEVRGRFQLRYVLRRWDFSSFEKDKPST